MPDAVEGILQLAFREKNDLSRNAYNLGGASLSAAEIIARVQKDFPELEVRFQLEEFRDRIVASWPAAVADRAARRDFAFSPAHDRETIFSRYLIPRHPPAPRRLFPVKPSVEPVGWTGSPDQAAERGGGPVRSAS